MGPLPEDFPLIPVMVSEVADGEFTGCVHSGPGRLVGCTSLHPVKQTWHIEVVECHEDPASVLAHEYLHVIINETEGRPDPHHEHPAWGVVAGRKVEPCQ